MLIKWRKLANQDISNICVNVWRYTALLCDCMGNNVFDVAERADDVRVASLASLASVCGCWRTGTLRGTSVAASGVVDVP